MSPFLGANGSEYMGSPFAGGGGLPGTRAAIPDRDDDVWNFAAQNAPITNLCGVRTDNCPLDMEAGEPTKFCCRSYVRGSLQRAG